MRKIIAVVISLLIVTCDGYDLESVKAIHDGALGKYCYRIVDEQGMPVNGAKAHVWFTSYGRVQDNANWGIVTDTNGYFEVSHRFNERFRLKIEKDGYYSLYDEIFYLGMDVLPVKDGKWQPFGEVKTMTLKLMGKHEGLRFPERQNGEWDIPVFGAWIAFDLELFDWTSPYGRGIHRDVLLRFTKRDNGKWNDFTCSMDVCFTNNPYGGAYVARKETNSDLRTERRVDFGKKYISEFSYVRERIPKKPLKVLVLDERSYLVFRTRTTVGENNQLLTAHYGTILGEWGPGKVCMKLSDGCFNPVPNEAIIEGGRYLRDLLKDGSPER